MSQYEVPSVVKYIEAESRMAAAVAGRSGNGEFVFNGYRVSVLQDGKGFARQSWMVVIVTQQGKHS